MARKIEDPGLGLKFNEKTKRVINKDGSFNVYRIGADNRSLYQYLIRTSWFRFIFFTLTAYFITNCLFALCYYLIGVQHLSGVTIGTELENFIQAFFFSAQTITTVGYGSISPIGIVTSLLAAFEAVLGLLGFALAASIMYGRFSKPSSKLKYSKNAIIVDNNGVRELHFRIANKRTNVLMEMEAKVLVKMIDKNSKGFNRSFYRLNLEIDAIHFFPLNWTIVHKIDEKSPLYNVSEGEMKERDLEVLILIKGFDDSFSQYVHSRHSYSFSEIVWNARFSKAYFTDEKGITKLDLKMLDDYEFHQN